MMSKLDSTPSPGVFRVCVFLVLCALFAGGCTPPKVINYESFHNKRYPSRDKPAVLHDGPAEDLIAGGYLLLGFIDLRRNIRECFDNFSCVSISPGYPEQTELLEEAALRGGDRVSLLQEEIILEPVSRNICTNYTTTAYYIDGKVQTSQTCVSSVTQKGHREARISKALIWRFTPEDATAERNYAAMGAAMKSMARAFGAETPARRAPEDDGDELADFEHVEPVAAVDSAPPRNGIEGVLNDESIQAAFREDRPERIVALLTGPDGKTHRDAYGDTFLSLAIVTKKPAMIEALLGMGITGLSPDQAGNTSLQYAAGVGDLDTLKRLVGLGGDVHALNGEGNNLLWEAAEDKDGEVMRWLLGQGLSPFRADHKGRVPTMVAAYHGNTAALGSLLRAGVGVDRRDALGRTALMYAAAGNQGDTIRRLRKSGAAIAARDNKGKTALIHAGSDGGGDAVNALLDLGADRDYTSPEGSALLYAVARENWGSTAALLKRGASLDVDGVADQEWLMRAISRNQHEITDLLLGRGLGVERVYRRRTPMQVAAESADARMIALLVSHGAQADPAGLYDMSPMFIASRSGNASAVQGLVDAGAKVDVKTSSGVTPLMLATIYGHTGVVRALRAANVQE